MTKFWKSFAAVMISLVAAYIVYGQVFTREINVSGLAPTHNDDGTPVTDMTSIIIYYSQDGAPFTALATVPFTQPGARFSYKHQDRSRGVHRYQATAVNADSIESPRSNTATRTFRATNAPTELTAE